MLSSRSRYRPHSKRALAIVSILLACLLLIAALGWQSLRLQQANADAATLVLRDYGMLAADEFGRRLSNSLGYYGYSVLIKNCTGERIRPLARPKKPSSTRKKKQEAGALVRGYFWTDGTDFLMDGKAVSDEMRLLIEASLLNAPENEGPYQTIRVDTTGERVVYTFRVRDDDPRALCGFLVNDVGVSEYAQAAVDRGPLLPASLADGLVGNDLLFVELKDQDAGSVFRINSQFDSHLTVDRPLPDASELGLAGYTIGVSLDPFSASMLVIGGLPESQLPWIFSILVMAVLLLVTAIWLFRREQAVMDMREDFVSQVSHELRTPLTQIRMFAETLLLNRTRSDDERQRSLEIIDREARRLSHLVENVLRVSKVSDAIEMDCQTQRLVPILQDVCDSMQSTADRITIDLRVIDDIAAHVDADAVRQIVLNLLDNAIKFGPDSQVIRVILDAVDGAVRVTVEDEGPGIPEVDRERVWDTFYRLGREKKAAISGTGIGLSVVRDLTQAMDGRCWIEGKERGARVIVELPEADTDD